MTKDLILTFPELNTDLNTALRTVLECTEDEQITAALEMIYSHCQRVYPDKFFDILYQNEKVFTPSHAADSEFLPGIYFNVLWQENLTESTRNTIWKYLQLILFAVVSDMTDGNSFGDASKLFEAINEDEFKNKLEETIKQMHDLFSENGTTDSAGGTASADVGADADTGAGAGAGASFSVPDPNDIHEHVTNMMKGKLGNLAQEIAAETAAELGMDMTADGNATSVNDIFKNLIKNPTKLMGLVQSVGSKLDQKLKSGDMKESELLQEASEILQKMKGMPGMGSMQSMFEKMGMGHMMPGGGKSGGQKVNVNAMQAQLQRNMKGAKTKERMLSKLAERQAAAAAAAQHIPANAQQPIPTVAAVQETIFQKGDRPERSAPSDAPSPGATANPKKKNKHAKKVKTQ
jgi:hypothetical protein